MKKFSYQWLCASVFVLIAGCGRPESKVVADAKPAPDQATPTPEAKVPESDRATKSDPKIESRTPELKGNGKDVPKAPDGSIRPDVLASGQAAVIQKTKQLEKAKVPQLDQSDWGTSDRTPQQIVKLADAAIGSLNGTAAETSMLVKNSAGTGQTSSKVQIQDTTHYSIEYIELVSGEPHTMIAKADGKRRGVLIASTFVKQGGWQAKAPLGGKGAIPTGPQLVAQWPTQFPRLVFAPLIESQQGFSAYLSALATKGTGYSIKSEKRVVPFNGRTFTSYRILAQQGGTRIEMVFDGNFNLPVTIRASVHPKQGKPSEMLWGTQWRFHQSIPAKTFEMPAKLG